MTYEVNSTFDWTYGASSVELLENQLYLVLLLVISWLAVLSIFLYISCRLVRFQLNPLPC